MPVEDLDSFIQEAALTRKLKHKYIVDYIGVGKEAIAQAPIPGDLFTCLGGVDLGWQGGMCGPRLAGGMCGPRLAGGMCGQAGALW